MDLEWTDGLCADEIVPAEEAQVNGGVIRRGGAARVIEGADREEAAGWQGRRVTVEAIAVGSKGKGPFRKRLWVALRIRDEAGGETRVLATDLEPVG